MSSLFAAVSGHSLRFFQEISKVGDSNTYTVAYIIFIFYFIFKSFSYYYFSIKKQKEYENDILLKLLPKTVISNFHTP
jgi:hypothetical protein